MNNLTVLWCGFILAFLGALASYITKLKKRTESNYKRDNWIASFTFLLVIIGSGMSWNSGRNSWKEKVLSDTLAAQRQHQLDGLAALRQRQVVDSLSTLLTYNQALSASDKKIIKIQNKLNEKQDTLQVRTNEVIRQQKLSLNEITGGSSFCYVIINIYNDSDGVLHEYIQLCNDSNYSLHNVHLDLQKPFAILNNMAKHMGKDNTTHTPLRAEYYAPRRSKLPIYDGRITQSALHKNEITYAARFYLENGESYWQECKLAFAYGQWLMADTIISSTNPEYKHNYVPPDYPFQPIKW